MALGWLWWRAWAWAPLVAGDATVLCVAGVAIGDIHLRFAWQVWRLVTSTFSIHSLCVESVALMALGWLWWRAWVPLVAVTPRHFAWQAWHLHRLVARYPTQSFTQIIVSHTSFTHTQLYRTQLFTYSFFKLLDPPPTPLSFLPCPSRYNYCFCLLEEVDLWGYPVL